MGKDLKGKELGVGITQRKNGVYQARYTDRFGNIKTIYNTNLQMIRKEQALAIAENINYTSIRQDIKLDEWFDRWMEIYKEKSIRPNTKREYTHIYKKNISPYLGNRNINSLVKSDIQKTIDVAAEKYGYERQNKVKVILTDMLERALEDELAAKNPCKGVKVRAEKEFNAKYLTVKEQKDFFEACKGTFYDNLFNVAINTGLRPGELFALTPNDIHLEEGYIDVNKTLVYQRYLDDTHKTFHIEPPKTKQSYRKVPINSLCKEYLVKQMELKKIVENKYPKEINDFLFITKFNTPLNSVLYSDAIERIVKEINLQRLPSDKFKKFSGHTFRHTFATRCFEAGISPKIVQAYLGHATLAMTMNLYTHATEEKKSDDIEKITHKESSLINFPQKLCI